MAVAEPASARRMAIDGFTSYVVAAPCAIGGACAASDLGLAADNAHGGTGFSLGVFSHLFVYSDGVVSFGSALPGGASVGDLSSLGNTYLAPGLADYSSALDFVSVTPIYQGYDDGSGAVLGEVRVQWVFDAPAASPNIFELDLFDESLTQFSGTGRDAAKLGDVNAQFLYGTDGFDFTASDGVALDSNFLTVDSYLLPGTVMAYRDGASAASNTITLTDPADITAFLDGGNGTGNTVAGIELKNFDSGVPEPSAWLTMILGCGLAGASMRWRRGVAVQP